MRIYATWVVLTRPSVQLFVDDALSVDLLESMQLALDSMKAFYTVLDHEFIFWVVLLGFIHCLLICLRVCSRHLTV